MIFLENIPFFDPYNFLGTTNIQNSNIPGTNTTKNNSQNSIPDFQQIVSPKEFYENQYIYYRYLNEVLEYQIKKEEYDKRQKKENNKE